MDRAIAISLGGISIGASDPRLRSTGYWEFGLRCSSCGEPVYWKTGWSIKPHFAHFPETLNSQPCSFRVTSSSRSYGYGHDQSYREYSILLKDIYGELIELLLKHHTDFISGEINVSPREEINPDEVEQNILNLLTYNKARNLAIFQSCFETRTFSFPLFLARSISYAMLLETNNMIGKEILSFLTNRSNQAILYPIVHFYKERESGRDTIQTVRRKVIESVAIKNWYVVLKYPLLRHLA